jgi:hypothetical protein
MGGSTLVCSVGGSSVPNRPPWRGDGANQSSTSDTSGPVGAGSDVGENAG